MVFLVVVLFLAAAAALALVLPLGFGLARIAVPVLAFLFLARPHGHNTFKMGAVAVVALLLLCWPSVCLGRCLCSLPPSSPSPRTTPASARLAGQTRSLCECTLSHLIEINTVSVRPRTSALLGTRVMRHVELQDLPPDCPVDLDHHPDAAAAAAAAAAGSRAQNGDHEDQATCAIRSCGIDPVDAATQAQLTRHRPRPPQHEPNTGADTWVAPMATAVEGTRIVYFDLHEANKEMFTGYASADAAPVWTAIHSVARDSKLRLVDQAVSGMHTSISSHVAAHYLLNGTTWGLNLDVYRERVLAHPQRIEGLVQAYLLVLRAVSIAGDWLLGAPIWSGAPIQDKATLEALARLLEGRSAWPRPSADLAPLVSDTDVLGSTFFKLTELTECVGCERCRLWARVQLEGLAVAFRILSGAPILGQLQPRQVVVLLQTLGRLADSIDMLHFARDSL